MGRQEPRGPWASSAVPLLARICPTNPWWREQVRGQGQPGVQIDKHSMLMSRSEVEPGKWVSRFSDSNQVRCSPVTAGQVCSGGAKLRSGCNVSLQISESMAKHSFGSDAAGAVAHTGAKHKSPSWKQLPGSALSAASLQHCLGTCHQQEGGSSLLHYC